MDILLQKQGGGRRGVLHDYNLCFMIVSVNYIVAKISLVSYDVSLIVVIHMAQYGAARSTQHGPFLLFISHMCSVLANHPNMLFSSDTI